MRQAPSQLLLRSAILLIVLSYNPAAIIIETAFSNATKSHILLLIISTYDLRAVLVIIFYYTICPTLRAFIK
ncbi:hypothetical protein HMPREF3208_00903 [Gardnerella vaginalis]|uniref:Uncharacterized protein n=1 Tax=Gardnerella vaginalis TaxID=2702 RepID=A0A133NUU5_GARVA|nr:hypothetical protein HMPREF3208_00903 [Gardnerella vaginalis]